MFFLHPAKAPDVPPYPFPRPKPGEMLFLSEGAARAHMDIFQQLGSTFLRRWRERLVCTVARQKRASLIIRNNR